MVWIDTDPTQGLLPKAVYFSHKLMVRMPDSHSLNMAVVGLQSGSPTYTCGFAWCTYYPYLTLHCHIQTTHALAIIIKKPETFRYFIGYHLWDIVSSITFPCLLLRETSVHTRYTKVLTNIHCSLLVCDYIIYIIILYCIILYYIILYYIILYSPSAHKRLVLQAYIV